MALPGVPDGTSFNTTEKGGCLLTAESSGLDPLKGEKGPFSILGEIFGTMEAAPMPGSDGGGGHAPNYATQIAAGHHGASPTESFAEKVSRPRPTGESTGSTRSPGAR